MTLSDFIRDHFETVILMRRPGGREHYRGIIHKHILPDLGSLRLQAVKNDHVQRLLNARLSDGYSVQTCIHIRNVVNRIFAYARVKGHFAGQLPSEGIELPDMERKERRALTPRDVMAIAQALQSPYREMVLLMSVAGLRAAEACGLKWKDVDFAVGIISLRQSFRRGSYQPLKTAGSKHPIPLDYATLADLACLKTRAVAVTLDDPVFCSSVGTPLWAATVLRRVLKPVLASLALPPDIGFHHLRHTAATLHEGAGATVTDRRRIMGWTTDSMALHYSHADLERFRGSVERVRALLDAGQEKRKVM